GAETRRNLIHSGLTEEILGAAIKVHRVLGPGLLESANEECLCREFTLRNLEFGRQVPLPIEYEGVELECGYRMDIVVKNLVVIELKCVDRLVPVHEAQLLTYMKLARLPLGLVLNFHAGVLTRGGVIRRVLSEFDPKSLRASASPR